MYGSARHGSEWMTLSIGSGGEAEDLPAFEGIYKKNKRENN